MMPATASRKRALLAFCCARAAAALPVSQKITPPFPGLRAPLATAYVTDSPRNRASRCVRSAMASSIGPCRVNWTTFTLPTGQANR